MEAGRKEESMKEFKGICATLLTPFDSTDRINHAMLKRQVRFLIQQGIDGFYVCGSTGEAFLLSMEKGKPFWKPYARKTTGKSW